MAGGDAEDQSSMTAAHQRTPEGRSMAHRKDMNHAGSD